MNLEKTIESLKTNGFIPHLFENKEEASKFLNEYLHNENIGFGGSKTLLDMGLYESLSENNKVFWHWKNPKDKFEYPNFTVYMCSANALSETGELVNIDGNGNRLASTLFGSDKLFFVVGQNKIEPDLAKAVYRAQNTAAPLNARRFGMETPEIGDPSCFKCEGVSKIANAMTIYMKPTTSFKEVHVVIIKENLGF